MTGLPASGSGIPRPKSAYTPQTRPSGAPALTPSRRINTGIPEVQTRAYVGKIGSVKSKSALSAPAVRPRPSHISAIPSPAIASTSSSNVGPGSSTTLAPVHGGLPRQASRPGLRKMASRPSLGKPERLVSDNAGNGVINSPMNTSASLGRKSGPRLSGGGPARKASRPGLRKIASRASLGKAERIVSEQAGKHDGDGPATEPASLGRKSGPRLSGGGLARKASRPGLRKVASRPSLGKAERVPVSTMTEVPTPTRLRAPGSLQPIGSVTKLRRPSIGSLRGAPIPDGTESNVPAVPAIPAKHLRPRPAALPITAARSVIPSTRVVPKSRLPVTTANASLVPPPSDSGATRPTTSTFTPNEIRPSVIPLPPTPLHTASPEFSVPSIETPYMPRIKRLSMTRPWDSPVSYSPLNNVQLSFDVELDSDSEDDAVQRGNATAHGPSILPDRPSPRVGLQRAVLSRPTVTTSRFDRQPNVDITANDTERLEQQARRIVELEAQLAKQQQDLMKAHSERDEAVHAQEQAEEGACYARAEWKQSRKASVQRQYDGAIVQGAAIRADLVAQLDLIRSIRLAYACTA